MSVCPCDTISTKSLIVLTNNVTYFVLLKFKFRKFQIIMAKVSRERPWWTASGPVRTRGWRREMRPRRMFQWSHWTNERPPFPVHFFIVRYVKSPVFILMFGSLSHGVTLRCDQLELGKGSVLLNNKEHTEHKERTTKEHLIWCMGPKKNQQYWHFMEKFRTLKKYRRIENLHQFKGGSRGKLFRYSINGLTSYGRYDDIV